MLKRGPPPLFLGIEVKYDTIRSECQQIIWNRRNLKNVSFHIEDHEKAAVVGINGAGKSTLLKKS